MGRTISVKVPLAETTLEYGRGDPRPTLVGTTTKRVDVATGVGTSLLDIAQPLVLPPIALLSLRPTSLKMSRSTRRVRRERCNLLRLPSPFVANATKITRVEAGPNVSADLTGLSSKFSLVSSSRLPRHQGADEMDRQQDTPTSGKTAFRSDAALGAALLILALAEMRTGRDDCSTISLISGFSEGRVLFRRLPIPKL